MKQCPRCSQTFADDMAFCLSDGTPLVALVEQQEEPTLVRRPRAASLRGGAGIGSVIKWIIGGALALLILAVMAGAALWILWPRERTETATNISATVTPSPKLSPSPAAKSTDQVQSSPPRDERANLQAQREALETERQKVSEERQRLEVQKQDPVETTRPESPTFNDPGVTRINFHRGSVGETVSGRIGNARSFVLRTLGGQNLSATVRSPGGCVVFTNGGVNTGYVTGNGDSYLNLRNNCGGPAKFSLNVVVR